MANITLLAEKRSDERKSSVRQLRNEGRVPANVYGQEIKNESIPVHIQESEILKLIQTGEARRIITLKVEDAGSYSVMLTEVQRNPIKGQLIHLDFIQVNMKEPIEVEVPIHLEGSAKGVSEGGVIQQQARTITIRCLPTVIPESLTLNVESLEIGNSLTFEAIQLPKEVQLVSDPEGIIVSIHHPRLEPVDDAEDQDEPPALVNEDGDKEHPDKD